MTTAHGHPISIRSHLLGIVLLGAIFPMAIIGFWLTRSGMGSGEDLLDEQLTRSLQIIEQSIAASWEYRRGDMLFLAGNESARLVLSSGIVTPRDSAFLSLADGSVARGIAAFTYYDIAGREVYTSTPRPSPASDAASRGGSAPDVPTRPPRRTMRVSYPVHSADSLVGRVDVDVYVDAIVPADSARLLPPGSSLALRDRASGVALVPLNGRMEFPIGRSIALNGAQWMVRMDSLADPPFDLAVAAPVAPYIRPFERTGRFGLVALGAVALLALALSSIFTARIARSFSAMTQAAGAVAGGDLSRKVEPKGPAEFHQLAGSFNAMTDSIRGLVGQLSERRALAAVGEFAASLSHEIRNALTSVQIDLERVDERTEDAKNRTLVARTLTHVRRLDAAVTGSLRIARSGTVSAKDVNLGTVIREAITIAEPSFSSSGARVIGEGLDANHVVKGDPDALHQLFLNLLLNAQQASLKGDTIVALTHFTDHLVVSISDSGSGMNSEQLARAFDPYYTTREKGTGLGLPIARQIALAHGGDVSIRSTPDVGTVVDVWLPITFGDLAARDSPKH